MDAVHEEEYKGYTIRIHADEDPENPRTAWGEQFGTMVCFHGRYDLGDQKTGYTQDQQGSWQELADRLVEDGAAVILPLYLYDHSGITMSTGKFSCPWDSGQVGFIFVSRAKILKEFGGMRVTKEMLAKAETLLQGEVETYDTYLRGNIYGYTIEDPEGGDGDSCGGFFGYYDEEGGALTEAKSIVDHEVAEAFTKQFNASMVLTGMEE